MLIFSPEALRWALGLDDCLRDKGWLWCLLFEAPVLTRFETADKYLVLVLVCVLVFVLVLVLLEF